MRAASWLPEAVALAWASLRAHKLRGGLTILGIVIGITSVVAMVSLVEGLNRSVTRQLASLGTDTIRVRRFDPQVVVGDLPDSLRKRARFDEDDAEAIREGCPAVLAVSVSRDSRERLRYRGRTSRNLDVTGVDAGHLLVNAVALDEGRYFTDAEFRGGARLAVIGPDVAEDLFPGLDPIGQTFSLAGQRFEVVGLAAARGKLIGQSLDAFVLIPLPAFERFIGVDAYPLDIAAKPVSPERTEAAKEEITEALRRSRGLRPEDDNDFALVTQENLLSLYRQITGAFFIVLVAIASVALLVGGIGVMNIMLVSVTERTQEIGIRKALGAKRWQIVSQFLAEAMALTAAGGVLGILLGMGVAGLVDAVTPLPAAAPLWVYVAAVTVSGSVGLFFGLWPAIRAARLDPVEALRYE